MANPTAEVSPGRLISLDAYRGFVMLAMASGGLGLASITSEDPLAGAFWDQFARQFEHSTWRGCTLWDMIQPAFLFIVGVALPFSYERRRSEGQPWARMLGHAAYRSLVLVLLGVFLASQGQERTNFIFTNVLAQIGLGYLFVFALLGRSPAVQLGAAVLILLADWLFFALHPVPHRLMIGREYASDWSIFRGLAAHWAPHTNAAADFDRWFLNLFPRPDGRPFTINPGGYTTLNFVPSMATMIFGVLAGQHLRSAKPVAAKVGLLLIAGALGVVLGSALDKQLGPVGPLLGLSPRDRLCPLVKRLWTPSWALFSTGGACLLLAFFYWIVEVWGYRRWAFPLVVVGANSIAMYLMAQLSKGWVRRTLKIHLGAQAFAGPYGPIIQSLAVLFVLWLVCFWMYRRRIFLKI